MKVLIIVQSFLPYGGAVNQLLLNLIKSDAFLKNSISCDVLTLKKNYDDKAKENIQGISVFRIENEEAYGIRQIIRRITSVRGVSVFINKCINKIHRLKAGEINNKLVRRITEFLSMHAGSYDIIVPVTGRAEMAEAFRIYAKNNNCMKKGVLYQVDPMAENEAYDERIKKDMERLERGIYSDFAYVLTTPIIYASNMKNGYDMNNASGVEFPTIRTRDIGELKRQEDSPVICLFSGFLHKKLRSPLYTLKLFSSLTMDKVKLCIAGNGYEELIKQYQKSSPEGRIVYKGLLSPQDVEILQNEADVLVNIGNTCANMVPSKIFEYMNTGKPILNICKNRKSPVLKYFDKYPLVLTLFEDDMNMTNQVAKLEKFLKQSIGKRVSQNEIASTYRNCTVEYVAEYISGILSQCVKAYLEE